MWMLRGVQPSSPEAFLMVRIVLTIETNESRAGTDHPSCASDILASFDAPFVAHIAGLASNSPMLDTRDRQQAKRMYGASAHKEVFHSFRKDV